MTLTAENFENLVRLTNAMIKYNLNIFIENVLILMIIKMLVNVLILLVHFIQHQQNIYHYQMVEVKLKVEFI